MTLREQIERDISRDDAAADRRAWWERYGEACRHGSDEGAPDDPLPPYNRAAEIAWHHDCGFIEGPEIGLEISAADRAFAFSADGAFLAHAKSRTGETVPDDKLAEMREATAELAGMSRQIAEKMGAAGFNAYRQTPFTLYRYFVHSREVEEITAYRRVTFIPSVAQAVRAPMLAAVESYIDRNPFSRMWTMTSGPRVKLSEIRDRARWMHGKLSDLNAQTFMRDAGVEIVFRSTELGTPEISTNGNPVNGGEIETDETGQMYFHVHAHCVVALKRGYIPPKKWEALLSNVGKFWVHWWKDGGEGTSGRIVDAREVCKYVTKPAEMLKLTGEQLVALQAQLSRLKLVQPMGQLAAEIKAREAAHVRLVKVRTPDGPVFREEKNWNRHNRVTRCEGHQAAAFKLDRGKKICPADVCRVVARLMPGFGPSGVSEPRVVVMTAGEFPEATVRADSRVARLIAATVDEYRAGVAIRVHTCTPTVLTPAAAPPWSGEVDALARFRRAERAEIFHSRS